VSTIGLTGSCDNLSGHRWLAAFVGALERELQDGRTGNAFGEEALGILADKAKTMGGCKFD
jgi:hypothetical protein